MCCHLVKFSSIVSYRKIRGFPQNDWNNSSIDHKRHGKRIWLENKLRLNFEHDLIKDNAIYIRSYK